MSERLSETCIGLAKHMSRRLRAALDYWDESELESLAMLSLVKAERTFDPGRGIKFSSWAGVLIERDSTDDSEKYEAMRTQLASFPMNTDAGRDGGFDWDEEYLVWELGDLIALRYILDAAIEVAKENNHGS